MTVWSLLGLQAPALDCCREAPARSGSLSGGCERCQSSWPHLGRLSEATEVVGYSSGDELPQRSGIPGIGLVQCTKTCSDPSW